MADRPTGTEISSPVSYRKTGAGSLFGLVINPAGNGVFYVDDGDNILKLPTRPRRRQPPSAILPSGSVQGDVDGIGGAAGHNQLS
jgi:hypothetical protein